MCKTISRREALAASAAVAGAAMGLGPVATTLAASQPPARKDPFRYCLNAALVMGYQLPLAEQIELAARAGYDAIEPWIRDIRRHEEEGGSLSDLRQRIAELGLTVESAIGFAPWIVNDPRRRAEGVEQMRRDMEAVARIGGTRIAAPPAGASKDDPIDLLDAAGRYRTILEIGDSVGVVPQLEVWGPSPALHLLGEAMFVVLESRHPRACLLPDFYHIHRGGSSLEGLGLLSPRAIHVFHMNDYPDKPRAQLNDSDRVFPGDGVARLPHLVRQMYDNGCAPVWSIELFNRQYWDRYDPPTIARIGLEKMKAVTAAALA
jgi:sugar phosphate isomerase/epimerase